jgi:hypothetical protein
MWTSRAVRPRSIALGLTVLGLACVSTPASAQQKVQITKLTDVAFGTITDLSVDAVRSQSVCVFSNTSTKGYNVRATGSGTGSAFTLSSGAALLAYEVQWNSSSGQTSGTSLTAGTTLTGLKSTATNATCTSGPLTSASLIVLIRSATLSSATATAYTGTLTLLIGPE